MGGIQSLIGDLSMELTNPCEMGRSTLRSPLLLLKLPLGEGQLRFCASAESLTLDEFAITGCHQIFNTEVNAHVSPSGWTRLSGDSHATYTEPPFCPLALDGDRLGNTDHWTMKSYFD